MRLCFHSYRTCDINLGDSVLISTSPNLCAQRSIWLLWSSYYVSFVFPPSPRFPFWLLSSFIFSSVPMYSPAFSSAACQNKEPPPNLRASCAQPPMFSWSPGQRSRQMHAVARGQLETFGCRRDCRLPLRRSASLCFTICLNCPVDHVSTYGGRTDQSSLASRIREDHSRSREV